MIYKDQLSVVESIISSCRTRAEVREKLTDFKAGYDLHHANGIGPQPPKRKVKTVTPRSPMPTQIQNGKPKVQTRVQEIRIVADNDEVKEIK